MTIVESRLRQGSLVLGGNDVSDPDAVEFACQASAVSITSDFEEDGDTLETLCGDSILPSTTESATLKFTAIQDFADPAGLVRWSWSHSLEVVPFSWTPNKSEVPRIFGEVQARRLDIGGDVNKRLTSDAEWPIQTGPTFDDAAPTATATAGAPGTFAPTSAMPADLPALQAAGVTASPATAWTTGQWVELGDASDAHWTGAAWAAGQAT
jgi:hypothetical protein